MTENLAMKTFVFQYFNCFFLFWYIAFVKRFAISKECMSRTIVFFDGKELEYQSCLRDLQSQLMIQAITFFFLNVVELAIPLAKTWLHGRGVRKSDEESVFRLDNPKEELTDVNGD